MTPKQALFVKEYLVDKNGTRAYMRAFGKKQNVAGSLASLLLKNVEVKAAVDEELKKQADKIEMTANEVLLNLKNIANVDLAEAYDERGELKSIHDMPERIRKSISGIETVPEYEMVGGKKKFMGFKKKLKFWDKPKTLELIGKHLKLFNDSPLVDPNAGNIQVILQMPANGREVNISTTKPETEEEKK